MKYKLLIFTDTDLPEISRIRKGIQSYTECISVVYLMYFSIRLKHPDKTILIINYLQPLKTPDFI